MSAYAHVPNGDTCEPVRLIRERIEEYALGFADTIIAAQGRSVARFEEYDPNHVGGDIGADALPLRQSVARPTLRWDPYSTPLRGLYLCSAATPTPPGPSVHGMCGRLAALSALRRHHGIRTGTGPVPAADSSAFCSSGGPAASVRDAGLGRTRVRPRPASQ
uniref:Phytoene dehydrogenase n=1 Tax=Streptomyces antibioticus TaxID=1890 RepID=A0A1S5RMQ5_STRAT|nr:phytoene dehydrogenase [Streptomyces antibioticus]